MGEVLFGKIDMLTRTSHDGYIDENGKMAFKKEGTPVSPEFFEKFVATRAPETVPQSVKEEIITSQGNVTAPRWGRFARFLRQAAQYHNVDIVELTEDKGWIMFTTFFTLRGRRDNIIELNQTIEKALEEYKKS